MTYTRRTLIHALSASAALAGTAPTARAQRATDPAQGYPSRPVRIVVPFAPGGGNDILARLFGQKLSERFRQNFLVDNRAGAGGQVGTEQVIRARPDGYTLVVNPSGPILANPGSETPAYDQGKDLAPIAVLATFPAFLLVAPDSPHRSLRDLVEWEKANPGQGTYGFGGLVFQMLMDNRICAPALASSRSSTAAPSTRSTPWVAAASPWRRQIPARRSRRWKADGYGRWRDTHRRLEALPDVPTITEAGLLGLEQDIPMAARPRRHAARHRRQSGGGGGRGGAAAAGTGAATAARHGAGRPRAGGLPPHDRERQSHLARDRTRGGHQPHAVSLDR